MDASGNLPKPTALSSSSGAFSTTSTSDTDVTNLSVSFKATGKGMVQIMLVSDGSANKSYLSPYHGTNMAQMHFKILRDSTVIAFGDIGCTGGLRVPPSAVTGIDQPSAGTYTYKVQVARNTDSPLSSGGSHSCFVYYCKLLVKEI